MTIECTTDMTQYKPLGCGGIGVPARGTDGKLTNQKDLIKHPQAAVTADLIIPPYVEPLMDPVDACREACKQQERTRDKICKILTERVKDHFKKMGCEVTITPKHGSRIAARKGNKLHRKKRLSRKARSGKCRSCRG